uniref:Uncharacterized protein n=1 Tax=Plectus sambesii TaxID=2011161 RepID=A0A914WE09_9BILA
MKQFMCILSWLMLEDTYAHYDNWSLRDKTTDTKERTKRETETLDTMSWFWIVAAIIVGVLALLLAVSMITQSPPATNILLRLRKRKSGGQRQKPSVDEEFPLGQLYHRNGQGGIIPNSDINVKQTGDAFISRQIAAKINDALLAGHSKGTMNPAFINDENRKPADSCNVTLCSKDSKDKENDSNSEKLSTLKVVSITEAEENEYSSSSKTPNAELNLKSEENGQIKKGTDIKEKSDLSNIADCNENKKEDVWKTKTAESSSGLGLSVAVKK